ncbi:MAG: hypothetical protein MJ128_00065 [Mogibacterium sp.]|nr:hypothetical protein [Mogibacterium sp.]
MNIIAASLIIMMMTLLVSCGGGGGGTPSSGDTSGDPDSSYEAPEFRDAKYDESEAGGNSEVQVGLSGVNEGYFALICNSDVKTKLQVSKYSELYR